jgi:hypothetical protein
MLASVDKRESRIGEGKNFHILGADELKAREPMTADSGLMKQVLSTAFEKYGLVPTFLVNIVNLIERNADCEGILRKSRIDRLVK